MITFFKSLSLLPLWLLHGLGWWLGWGVFAASGTYRRRFVAHAHQAGLGVRDWLPAVGESGKLLAELPRLWLGRPVTVLWADESLAWVEAAHKPGRGVVFLTPHLGCFEAAAQAYAQRFGQTGQPMTVLYRPPRQGWLHTLVQASRQRPGLQTAPTSRAGVRQMLKALKAGEVVALLPDQVPPLGMGLMAPFFGRDAYTMTLSARLIAQTGAAVGLVWCERLAWGRGYLLHVQPLSAALPAALPEAVAALNEAMEMLIWQCPSQYLWGYARYKQPRESA